MGGLDGITACKKRIAFLGRKNTALSHQDLLSDTNVTFRLVSIRTILKLRRYGIANRLPARVLGIQHR